MMLKIFTLNLVLALFSFSVNSYASERFDLLYNKEGIQAYAMMPCNKEGKRDFDVVVDDVSKFLDRDVLIDIYLNVKNCGTQVAFTFAGWHGNAKIDNVTYQSDRAVFSASEAHPILVDSLDTNTARGSRQRYEKYRPTIDLKGFWYISPLLRGYRYPNIASSIENRFFAFYHYTSDDKRVETNSSYKSERERLPTHWVRFSGGNAYISDHEKEVEKNEIRGITSRGTRIRCFDSKILTKDWNDKELKCAVPFASTSRIDGHRAIKLVTIDSFGINTEIGFLKEVDEESLKNLSKKIMAKRTQADENRKNNIPDQFIRVSDFLLKHQDDIQKIYGGDYSVLNKRSFTGRDVSINNWSNFLMAYHLAYNDTCISSYKGKTKEYQHIGNLLVETEQGYNETTYYYEKFVVDIVVIKKSQFDFYSKAVANSTFNKSDLHESRDSIPGYFRHKIIIDYREGFLGLLKHQGCVGPTIEKLEKQILAGFSAKL